MLLVFQFPVSDTRPFRVDSERRVNAPHWPSPVTDIRPEFVHYFGRAVERRRGADTAWTDELSFCLAGRAIRFEDLATRRLGPLSARVRPAAAFRRLFADGRNVARLEVGITHNRRFGPLGQVDAAAILQIASDACALPTWVPQPWTKERDWKPLLRQGKALANLYARATEQQTTGVVPPPPTGNGLVCPGRPLVLMELSRSESVNISPPFTTLKATDTRGANLSFGRLRSKAGVVDCWILQPGTATKNDLRSLRLCLMRLHAEQECLDLAMTQVQERRIPFSDGSTSDVLDDLNTYFDKATRLIQRASWGGISQSAILTAYDAAEQITPMARRVMAAERLEGARLQLRRKIDDYQARRGAVRLVSVLNVAEGGIHVEKNVTVSGQGNIVNVAEFMSGVTNTVNQNLTQSNASAEVQELVKKLTEQINALSTKVDPAKTQQMGGDLETLSKEISQAQPRKKWYELSLEGLKEAAEAVGEIGKPIVQTVKLLWPLLVP